MSKVDKETVTTFAEVFSTAGVTYHQQSCQTTADSCPIIYFQGMKVYIRRFPAGDDPKAAPGDEAAMIRHMAYGCRG